MTHYVLSTYSKTNNPQEKSEEQKAAWDAYFAKSVDVAPGQNVTEGVKTVLPGGQVTEGAPSADYGLNGVVVFDVADENEAIEIAKTCPILQQDGAVAVHALKPSE